MNTNEISTPASPAEAVSTAERALPPALPARLGSGPALPVPATIFTGIKAALEAFQESLLAAKQVTIIAFSQLQEFCLQMAIQRPSLAKRYAVLYLGITEADIRKVVFNHPEHGDHILLWNHRRVSLPEDWL